MNITDLTSIDAEKGISITENAATYTDTLLAEVSNALSRGNEEKDKPVDASIAFETLNNVLKAFTTIAGMNGAQAHEPVEPDGDPQADSGIDVSPSENNDPGQTELAGNSGQINAKEDKVKDASPAENSPTESETPKDGQEKAMQEKPATGQADGGGRTLKTGTGLTTKEMIRATERRMWFVPINEDDSEKIAYLMKIQQMVSSFRTYHELIAHLYMYVKSGNRIDPEVYFLLRCAYVFDNLEKYHIFFRNSMFDDNPMTGGWRYMIDAILDSIHYRQT
ncbi:MAG: hypothetical protein K5770_12470 [Lachnospiraceae bacterium]|nr:hypothetical protein [Lachnospiraceae bacterium]